ncbi:MAG: hypothetical protein ABFS14_00340 [Gemmatimonadota bacterium]
MRRTILAALAVVLGTGVWAAPANAQSAQEEEAKAAAMEVITGFFDAVLASDSAAARSLFHPNTQLASSGANPAGAAGVRYTPIGQLFDGLGGSTAGDWNEEIGDTELRVYDNLVTAANRYVFRFKGEVSHCGVNTWQIAKIGDEWKVVGLVDTRRRQTCDGWLE